MSEPKTSEPLHSSCTRTVSGLVAIGDRGDVAEHVQRHAADRRQEHVEIAARHQLGEHAAGVLEQRAAQVGLGAAEAPRDAGQVPDRLDRGLDDDDVAGRAQHRAVGLQPPGAHRVGQLGQPDVGLGDRDRRLDVVALLEVAAEGVADDRAERIERHDLLGVGPRGERPERVRRRGVGEIRLAQRIERAGRHRERAIDRVRAGVRPDHVAVRPVGDRRHQRPAARPDRRRPRRSGSASVRGRPGAT